MVASGMVVFPARDAQVYGMTATVECSSTRRRGINDWFAQIPGSLILDAEVEIFNRTLPNLFGYHLLQVGRLARVDMIGASRILNRMIIDIDGGDAKSAYSTLRGEAHALPIESDSVDVVVLAHVLEFEPTPHEALREAQRVLVPEGHVVIAGFNPWSLMGIWRAILHRSGVTPWSGDFLGLNRLEDWLALLSFDVTQVESLFFRPPFKNTRIMERLSPVERIGDRFTGWLGAGAYVLVGRKRVSTLTQIKPRWSTRRRLVSVGIVGPTARVGRTQTHPAGAVACGGTKLRTTK